MNTQREKAERAPFGATAHLDTFVLDGLPPAEQWPDLLFDRPELRYPERLNAAAELLDQAVHHRGWGDRPCMSLGSDRWTYRDLLEASNRVAHVLVDECGVVSGNRILLLGANSPSLVATWFATLKTGCVAVTTMPLARRSELEKIREKCRPSVALCQSGMDGPLRTMGGLPVLCWGADGELDALAAAKPVSFTNVDTAASDPALLGLTSGTTGEPKAAIHFHRDLLVVADTFLPLLKPSPNDVFVGSPPLAFTFGLGGLVVFPMRVGASTVFCPNPGPEPLVQLLEACQATVCFTAPTAYRFMLQRRPAADLSSLRRAVSAGEHLPAATFRAFEQATGIRLIDGLGATEMLHIFVSSADDDIRPGAIGKPLPGYDARIVDDDGEEVPDGTVGRLAVRGPVGCRYLNDDRQRDYVQRGWNITGDACVRDRDGYFYYRARTDDMIVSAGYNIAPGEVEEALNSHPAVAEAAAIGTPDPERGMAVKAVVRLRDPDAASDRLAQELQAHVKAMIAPYKYPRAVAFSAEPLPRSSTGKLQRSVLRARDA